MLITFLVFIAILGLLVFVHELGHFLVARWSGVKVEEFAFGFKPRIIGKKIGPTLYALNLIPLGGYVKMLGEGEASTDPQSYSVQPAYKRFLILVAGSVMNLLLGWVLLTVLFAHGFNTVLPGVENNPYLNQQLSIKITDIFADSPAQTAGLQVGDRIVSLNNQPVKTDLQFVGLVNADRGQPVSLTINRADQTLTLPLLARANPPGDQGPLGVTIESTGTLKAKSLLLSPLAGLYQTGAIIILSARGFISFLADLVVHHQVSPDVTGVVGIGALTGVARRLGWQYLTQLVIVITIGLGVVNLMPILPLDGGHVAAVIYEKLAGRKLTEKQLNYLTTVGLGLVAIMFLVVTYKDIIRFNVFGRLF
jgi:regulator of sigma E protease